MNLLHFQHSNPSKPINHPTNPTPSQQRHPGRSHRDRSPNGLDRNPRRSHRPRSHNGRDRRSPLNDRDDSRLRRCRRSLQILRDDARLHALHAQPIGLIRSRQCGAHPARRRRRLGQPEFQVADRIGPQVIQDGGRRGGGEQADHGRDFGVGEEEGDVGVEVVEYVGGLWGGGV